MLRLEDPKPRDELSWPTQQRNSRHPNGLSFQLLRTQKACSAAIKMLLEAFSLKSGGSPSDYRRMQERQLRIGYNASSLTKRATPLPELQPGRAHKVVRVCLAAQLYLTPKTGVSGFRV